MGTDLEGEQELRILKRQLGHALELLIWLKDYENQSDLSKARVNSALVLIASEGGEFGDRISPDESLKENGEREGGEKASN